MQSPEHYLKCLASIEYVETGYNDWLSLSWDTRSLAEYFPNHYDKFKKEFIRFTEAGNYQSGDLKKWDQVGQLNTPESNLGRIVIKTSHYSGGEHAPAIEKVSNGRELFFTVDSEVKNLPLVTPKDSEMDKEECLKQQKGYFSKYDDGMLGVCSSTQDMSSALLLPTNKIHVLKRPPKYNFMRVNPFKNDLVLDLGGRGMKQENVLSYKYCLVEFDSMPDEKKYEKNNKSHETALKVYFPGLTEVNFTHKWETVRGDENKLIPLTEQLGIMARLNLPVVDVVYSGGKSLHFIIQVDAETPEEFKRRTGLVHAICWGAGGFLDISCKDYTRFTRVPGVYREDKSAWQKSIELPDDCSRSFYEWETDVLPSLIKRTGEPSYPTIRSMRTALREPEPLKEELIEGILRRGDKMIISSGSKAGKSWFLLQLSMAFVTGGHWLRGTSSQLKCKPSNVLFVDFELQNGLFDDRLNKIVTCMEVKEEKADFDYMCMRGHDLNIDRLFDEIALMCSRKDYDVIILDPIYKLQAGDENSAGDINTFCNRITKLSARCSDAAIIYTHHFAKGSAANKDVMDRASGSGVFARDPDTIIAVTPLDEERTFVMDFVLRGFKPVQGLGIRKDGYIMNTDDSINIESLKGATKVRLPNKKFILAKVKGENRERSFVDDLKPAGIGKATWDKFIDTLLDNQDLKEVKDGKKTLIGVFDDE